MRSKVTKLNNICVAGSGRSLRPGASRIILVSGKAPPRQPAQLVTDATYCQRLGFGDEEPVAVGPQGDLDQGDCHARFRLGQA